MSYLRMEYYFELGYRREVQRRVTNEQLSTGLRSSNKLVYKLAIGLEIGVPNYFVCSHFYFHRLFHVYLFNSCKTSKLYYFNWEIDVLRFIINEEILWYYFIRVLTVFALSFIISFDISLQRNERYATFLRIILVL